MKEAEKKDGLFTKPYSINNTYIGTIITTSLLALTEAFFGFDLKWIMLSVMGFSPIYFALLQIVSKLGKINAKLKKLSHSDIDKYETIS